jgi:AcrR family transcriptional regulator
VGPADEPRDRKSVTDDKVFRATVDLLRAVGTRAVTIEAVAARSGVAKTTIYRRYADRNEMLQAALNHYLPVFEDHDRTDPRRTLTAAVTAVSQTIEHCIGLAIATMLVGNPDPAAAIVRSRVVEPRIEALTSLLTDWMKAGSVREDLDVDIAIGMIMGSASVTYARFGTFPPGWPERFVDQLWPTLAPSTSTPTPTPTPTPTGSAGEG